ncbi:MAG: hypothetical protein ACRCYS_10410, partial [Beijerinckiaceae bacterium]
MVFSLMRPCVCAALAGFAVLGAGAAAHAQDAATDALYATKTLDGEFFRSDDMGVTIGLRADDQGPPAITTMTVTVKSPQGDQSLPVENAERVSYDPTTRIFQAQFRRNEARVRALDGVLAAESHEFYQLRTFTGTLTFESGRTMPLNLKGTLNALSGKPGCFFDLFAGASLAAVTLKRRYVPAQPDWLQPVAQQQGWIVLRRRIDYVRGDEEYDIATGVGSEIAALHVIRTLPEVACIAFGADETDAAAMMRIIAIPRGTLMSPSGGLVAAEALKEKISASFPNVQALTVTRPEGERSFLVSLRGPGRLFGLTQFGNDMFDV